MIKKKESKVLHNTALRTSKQLQKKKNLDCDQLLPAILFLTTGSPAQVLCYFVLWQDVFQKDFDYFLPFLKNFFCCVAPHMLSKYYNCSGASPCSIVVCNSQSQMIGLCFHPWCSQCTGASSTLLSRGMFAPNSWYSGSYSWEGKHILCELLNLLGKFLLS